MIESYDLSKCCVVASAAQLVKAPWAIVEQTCLSGRATSLMGPIILPHAHAFFFITRANQCSRFMSPWASESRCAAASGVVLGAGIYSGLPSCLLNPRSHWQSVGQCHFVVLTTSSSSTTRLSRQRRVHLRHLVVVDSAFAATPIV